MNTPGATPYSLLSANTVNATVVKATRGILASCVVVNTNADERYLKFYNKATTPAETDTPVWRVTIPGNASGAGVAVPLPHGLAFSAGIAFRLTTGSADNDTGAVGAGEITVNLGYF